MQDTGCGGSCVGVGGGNGAEVTAVMMAVAEVVTVTAVAADYRPVSVLLVLS